MSTVTIEHPSSNTSFFKKPLGLLVLGAGGCSAAAVLVTLFLHPRAHHAPQSQLQVNTLAPALGSDGSGTGAGTAAPDLAIPPVTEAPTIAAPQISDLSASSSPKADAGNSGEVPIGAGSDAAKPVVDAAAATPAVGVATVTPVNVESSGGTLETLWTQFKALTTRVDTLEMKSNDHEARIQALERGRTKVRKLPSDSAAPAPAAADGALSNRIASAAIRIVHGPFTLQDGDTHTTLNLEGKAAPVYNFTKTDRGYLLTVNDAVLTSKIPQSAGAVTSVHFRIDGTVRRFLYVSKAPVEATASLDDHTLHLDFHPAARAAVVSSASSTHAGTDPLLGTVQKTPAVARDVPGTGVISGEAPRWYIKAITSTSAVLTRDDTHAVVTVFIGNQVDGFGRVLSIASNEVKVYCERGAIGLQH